MEKVSFLIRLHYSTLTVTVVYSKQQEFKKEIKVSKLINFKINILMKTSFSEKKKKTIFFKKFQEASLI